MTYYITHLDTFKTHPLPEEDFERFLPPLAPAQANNITALQTYLAACDESLRTAILHPFTARDVHRLRSRMIDRLMLTLFKSFVTDDPSLQNAKISFVAAGGYGRQEMSLYSDIDILFLHDGTQLEYIKPAIEKLLYVLWDLKLDLGQAVRTLQECKTIIATDHTVLTNLLEARLLDGNATLFAELKKLLTTTLKNSGARQKFIADKLKERDVRHAKFGGSVYLIEPNLKEGKGGLRDLHLLRWLAAATGIPPAFSGLLAHNLVNEEECKVLDFSLRFLLQVRNRLHLLKKRKVDQIHFDSQEILARSMGFSDSESGILAVEQFMQSYYTVASQVKKICGIVIRKIQSREQGPFKLFINKLKSRNIDEHFRIHDDQIVAKNEKVFETDPFQLMQLFRHVQQTGLDIHFDTKDLVNRSLYLVNDSFRSDPKISTLFRLMMADLNNLDRALFAMHDVHFFDSYIPEFRKLRNRVQHDIYHVYTVDTHSIFAISELAKLARGEYSGVFDPYRKALAEVKQPDLLSMGLLFHDIGKGEGGNHSIVGVTITRRVTERLGYSEDEKQTIDFLILSHLMMPHLSQRRDLEDEHLVHEFAKTIQTLDRLNMLFILTWGDIRAVSAESWTDWKGTLLSKLYEKTKIMLQEKNLSEDYAHRRASDLRKAILARMRDKTGLENLEKFLGSISPRYLVAHTDEEIYEHFQLISQSAGQSFIFREKATSTADVSEVLIYVYNNPRVLALITGVMLANGINILDMEVFTLTQGYNLIKLSVQTEFKTNLKDAELAPRLEKNLKDVFIGKEKVDQLIAKRKRPAYMGIKKPVQRAESKIDIDNDVSPYFTIIDVFTHDRLGLLYDIIRCLTENGCYVEVSKISTKVEQVVDSFYVKDIFGHKFASKTKLAEIKLALAKVIEPTIETNVNTTTESLTAL